MNSFQDGDGVTFGFVGGTTTSGLFRIEPNTGVIRLINGPINLDRDKYELNVTAMDNGKCCMEGGREAVANGAVVVSVLVTRGDPQDVCPNVCVLLDVLDVFLNNLLIL